MRAAVMRNQKLVVDTLRDPEPAAGQVLARTLACGICGTDLHALRYGAEFIEKSRASSGPFEMDVTRDVVMGHEFSAELVDYGPDCERKLGRGTRVCSMPAARMGVAFSTIGYSNDAPGGYGELMLLTESMLLPVPNALSSESAALTEPMAVGLHAVARAELTPADVPLVIGCGPVGLSVVASLKLRGAEPVIAADYSPRRRELARALGADIAIDPAESSPYQSFAEAARGGPEPLLEGQRPRPGLFFDCVGVPGIIQQLMGSAPRRARIIVVGVCMQADRFEPLYGINKELDLRFVLGYTGAEFAATLRHIAEGELQSEPLITGKVGVEGVARAFEELGNPELHAKILVEPWRS